MHWLYWLYFLLLLVTDVCGLVLAAFTLPGLWLMLAGAGIYAWLTHGEYIGYKTLIVLLILAVGAEIAEIFVSGAGAKKAGASRWGMFGGLLGGIIGGIFLTGLIPIPILGTVIGICLGSFVGAFSVEMVVGKPLTQSAVIGYGAAKGRFTGILYKIGIGIAMFLITLCFAPPFLFFSKSRAIPARPAPTPTKPSTPATTRVAISTTEKLKGTDPVISIAENIKGTWTVFICPALASHTNISAEITQTPVLRYSEKRGSWVAQPGSSEYLRTGVCLKPFEKSSGFAEIDARITVHVPFNFSSRGEV